MPTYVLNATPSFYLTRLFCVALASWVALGSAAEALAAKRPEIAVVPLSNHLGKSFDRVVAELLMEPLLAEADLTPLPKIRKRVALMHMAPKVLHLPHNLQVLGKAVGASHVLVVEAVGSVAKPHAFAGLVNVHDGNTLFAMRMPMPHRTLTPSDVKIVLHHVHLALLESGPTKKPIVADTPTAVEEEPLTADADDAAVDKEKTDKAAEADKALDAEITARQKQKLAQKEGDDFRPPWARLSLGLDLLQRVGNINAVTQAGDTTPCYCGTTNNANPFFPMFRIDGEVYVGALPMVPKGFWQHFGIMAGLGVTGVKSYTSGDANATISSTVMALDLDATYRQHVYPHKNAPWVSAQVGYNSFSFPLKNAAFPGVSYSAANLALGIDVPLTSFLSIGGNGAYKVGMKTASDAARELGTQSGGHGFLLGGALKVRYKFVVGELTYRWESFNVHFKGATALPNTQAGTALQFNDVTLTDVLKQIGVRVGVAF